MRERDEKQSKGEAEHAFLSRRAGSAKTELEDGANYRTSESRLTRSVTLALQFGHGGLDELLGAVDLIENGLQVERRLGGIAAGDAVDAVLADEDERVGEHIERDGEAASLGAEHELVFL